MEEKDGGMEQRSSFNLCFAELSGSCHRGREGEKRDGDEWVNKKRGEKEIEDEKGRERERLRST